MKITNKDVGPRGFWRDGRLVMLDSGASIDAELSAADMAAAKSTGFFDFEVPEPNAEPEIKPRRGRPPKAG